MFELVQAGGWLMIPILLCSVIAAAIVIERLWTLRQKKVIPAKLLTGIWNLLNTDSLTDQHIDEIERGSPLGRVLAAGLINRHLSRDMIRESIEETGRHVVHEMERFMNALGTISTITPKKCRRSPVMSSPSCATTIPGTAICRSRASAMS